ncbi:TetR/AcrR family transcriptional regulator [Fulvivirga lutimaris]|uniref:TetR/AcrR family transcriptional regulator n=1 Tax=Fulvivirga lutimaris TaxID=1819566 RepID=UPI0012BCB11F|nr:TetR/AcrR family transcriptional regulator [Fulvivirga lutimaris]MTI40267.1 TetR/AcrR family transcriptional regulator [Fulvivirga lutimaris]
MTEKKENILSAALELFAQEGFKSTSTSKLAAQAGVSEGLIFRHFKSKEGLLKALMDLGEERLEYIFADIITESDPQEVINKALTALKTVAADPEQAHFWKLQYKLKWETETYDDSKVEPIKVALTNAFEKLGYSYPEKEAQLILILMDGMVTKLFLSQNFDINETVDILIEKYKE